MAKLDAKTAKAVDKTDAAGGGFEPIPEGDYYATLTNVDPTREGPAGPYWSWEFTLVPESEYPGRKFWTNTSLGESSRPFFKRMFDAFGVPANTDTDDLQGQPVKLHIKEIIIRAGTRAGEPGNEIALVSPYDGPPRKEGDDFPY